jgi:sorting nexin-1/2
MAHFDDLLRSSRNELEENPFGDPFAPKRSSSPDPWANPYAEPQDEDPIAYGTGLEHESIEQSPLTPEPTVDVAASDGPLDLASIEVEEPPLSTSTSGFREFSVPSNAESEALAKFDAAETGGTTAETPTLPSAPALPLSHTTSIPTTPSTPPRSLSWETQTIQEPGSPATASSASWQPHVEPTFISPLDGRQAPLASQSNGFSNFGDDSEGWNASGNNSINEREPSASSTAAWHSRQSTEEDDDDDRPLQAIVDKSRADAEAKQSLVSQTLPDTAYYC